MGRLRSRAEHCLHCGAPMPTQGRINRRYCRESCRVLAYRTRARGKQVGAQTNKPAWTDGPSPLLNKALAALAELQAQIVSVGHSLQAEDQAERRGARTAPTVESVAEADDLRAQLKTVEARLAAAHQRITDLEKAAAELGERPNYLEARLATRSEAPAPPAPAPDPFVEILTKPSTDEEARLHSRLRAALNAGYNPQTDPLVHAKLDELIAEQDLADDEERVGGVPSLPLHREGCALLPMAIAAARKARLRYKPIGGLGLLSRARWDDNGMCLDANSEQELRRQSLARCQDLIRLRQQILRR